MTNSRLEALEDKQLIDRFANAAHAMGLAVLDSEVGRANRALNIMQKINGLLVSRGDAACAAFAFLLNSDDRFVRYYAAKFLLKMNQNFRNARQVVEENAKSWSDAVAGDAGMTLLAIERGYYQS